MDYINMRFNRTNTKHLLKSHQGQDKLLLQSLKWSNKNKIYGFCYKSLFGNQVFILIQNKNNEEQYQLITSYKGNIYNYMITDIEEFLEYITPEELNQEKEEDEYKEESFNFFEEMPSTGVVEINDDCIFLYDFTK